MVPSQQLPVPLELALDGARLLQVRVPYAAVMGYIGLLAS